MNKLYLYYGFLVGKKGLLAKSGRYILKYLYNLIGPVFYRFKNTTLSGNSDLIISLTTFPDRISKTWLVIETLFDQTIKPDKIVLTLSLQQFPDKKNLPKKLLLQKERGLEIIWTNDDLRSHKKYYYVMKKYPQSKIVTVDDDFFYSKGMLENLLKFHNKHPQAIICHLAAKRRGNNYNNWENLLFKKAGPTKLIMQYGGSGVLYPPNALFIDAFDKEKIKEMCPFADDIWLNCMSILNGCDIVKTDYPYYLLPLKFKKTLALKDINVDQGMNTKQIEKLKNFYGNYP